MINKILSINNYALLKKKKKNYDGSGFCNQKQASK